VIDLEDLPERVTVQALTGAGPYGPQYSAPQSDVPALVEDVHDLVRTSTGEEVLVRSQVFLPPTVTVTAGSLITVDGVERAVVTVEHLRDDAGPHHVEVRLQ